tara:strand:+ start:354 stop:575 length:222 start_codon:yes stop_codon:yes gene_type:complete
MKIKKIIKYISLTIILYFSTVTYAYSYIDISIIAVFFQMIFAGIIAALLTIKLWFQKAKNLFQRLFKKKTNGK